MCCVISGSNFLSVIRVLPRGTFLSGKQAGCNVVSPNLVYGPESAGPITIISKQFNDKTRREDEKLYKKSREAIVSFLSAIKAYGKKWGT